MSDQVGAWVPLSVRRGIREPFRLVEGIPEHARPAIDGWVETVVEDYRGDARELYRFIISSLRLSFHAELFYHLADGLRGDDDRYLDVLDLLSHMFPANARKLEEELNTAGSAWRVDEAEGGLLRRVPREAQKSYEQALETQPSAAEHLSGAWEHAFGRHPDAGDAWGDALRAVEAALHQIISPANEKATLGSMKSELRQAPAGKFIIRAAGTDPKETLLGMLDAVPYENGRHGTDRSRASIDTARIVVFQATAIVAGVGEGLIERADLSSEEGA